MIMIQYGSELDETQHKSLIYKLNIYNQPF